MLLLLFAGRPQANFGFVFNSWAATERDIGRDVCVRVRAVSVQEYAAQTIVHVRALSGECIARLRTSSDLCAGVYADT